MDALLERLGGPDLAAGLMGCSAFGRLPLNLAVRGVRPSAAKALVEAHRAHALDPSKPLAVNKEDLMVTASPLPALSLAHPIAAMRPNRALNSHPAGMYRRGRCADGDGDGRFEGFGCAEHGN